MDVTYFNNNVRHWCISKEHPIIYIYIYIFNDKQIEFGCESVAQGTKDTRFLINFLLIRLNYRELFVVCSTVLIQQGQ